MAIHEILHFPDPRLRQKAKPVQVVNVEIQQLVADMFETMYAAKGIGLAAVQINVPLQVIVMHLNKEGEETQPLCFINPEITHNEGTMPWEEGCLSVPGFYENVQRAERIRVRALDREGNPFELNADGLLGVCIQHEMDHLNGKLFVDHLSFLKRSRIQSKLQKQARLGQLPKLDAQKQAS